MYPILSQTQETQDERRVGLCCVYLSPMPRDGEAVGEKWPWPRSFTFASCREAPDKVSQLAHQYEVPASSCQICKLSSVAQGKHKLYQKELRAFS